MMIVQMVTFLSLAVAVLFGAHFFVYISLVHFFSVVSASYKYVIALALTFLSFSFILSSIVAHYYENIITRAAYFLSGLWLGLLVNLVLALPLLWLTYWLFQSIGLSLNKAFFAVFFIGAAGSISLYGVWRAVHPVVKHVTVSISGLPEVWKGRTIVQLSDVHLGHIYQAGFLRGVVTAVNTLHPKIVVITGDLFDGMDGHLDSLVQPFNTIQSDNGVYFVIGNHETYLGVETALAALKGTQVAVLKDEVRDVDGLRLIGLSFPSRGEKKDIIATLKTLQDQYSGQPNVLLYHAPVQIKEVAVSGVNLMLSGHTHQGQQFPFRYITALVHKGFDYGLYTIGSFHLYTSSGLGTWGPTMRIGTQSEIVAITLTDGNEESF